MFVELCKSEDYWDTICEFRREISRRVGRDPNGPSGLPLYHSFYILGFPSEGTHPGGMAEFFFYDQAFANYHSAPYNRACDLSEIAPLGQMTHVRSLIIRDQHRSSRLFFHLCAALLGVAYDLDARYMTATTNVLYDAVVHLHRKAGMRTLGTIEVESTVQQVSVLELEPIVQRVRALRDAQPTFDPTVIRELRSRKADSQCKGL